jgi:cellulose synthase/poly-beta-1,6-N-acetylglucosamine synthase-like glycosyltransferase
MAAGTVCVVIPVKDDPHVAETVASLASQARRPDRILVVATPETPADLLEGAGRRAAGVPFEVLRVAGYVVAARQAALGEVREAVTVFLDSDQTAPPGWLAQLVAPVDSGAASFSGGPTRPDRPPENSVESYVALLERSIYEELVPGRVTYLPLGNTAWRTEVLRELGFDPRLPGAEDHDLETRAAHAGHEGVFVPGAWVLHSKANVRSFSSWARRRYRAYLVPMAMSLLKNGELAGRLRERRRTVRHPLAYVELVLKPLAFADAWARWHRAQRETTASRRGGVAPAS